MNESKIDKMIQAVDALKDESFDWKTFNCGFAAATIAQAYCGKDYAENFRPFCEGKLTAMRIIKKAGGLEFIMDDLGFEEIPVSFARRCDCVLSSGKAASLGIVYDGRRAVFPTQFGLGFIDVSECRKAWRI